MSRVLSPTSRWNRSQVHPTPLWGVARSLDGQREWKYYVHDPDESDKVGKTRLSATGIDCFLVRHLQFPRSSYYRSFWIYSAVNFD